MKAVNRRSLPFLTALMLVLSMFALVPEGLLRADAAIAYGIVVGGVEVTAINKDDILRDGNFSYDPNTKTLFVKGDLDMGKEYGRDSEEGIRNLSVEGLTINVVNDSVITMHDYVPGNSYWCIGLHCSTTITGNGKLTLVIPGPSGICVGVNIESGENGDLVIEDANIECISGDDGFWSTIKNGKLIIRHSTVKMQNGNSTIRRFPKGIELENCKIVKPSSYNISAGTLYDDKHDLVKELLIKPENYIDTVSITIPEPKAGEIITDNQNVLSVTPSDMSVTVYNSSNTKNKVTWSDPPYMIQLGVTEFKNGKTYTLSFKLAQTYTYGQDAPEAELSEKTSVKVNGRQAEFTGKDGFYYTYQLKFTVGGLKGDVDGNGVINMKDLATLQRYVNGWDVTINEANSDLDDSGSINMKDVAALQRLINSL